MKRTVHHSDGRSDGPKPFSPRRIELYTGSQGRRRWPDEVKARIVVESFAPGTVVTQLAQRHGCRPQQIHDWRRLARTGKLALPAAASETLPAFVPLLPDSSAPASAGGAADRTEASILRSSSAVAAKDECIAVEIADATVHVSGQPGAEALLNVFSALRRSRRC